MSRRLPRGRVTFAFVDVVESTKTFAEHGEVFVAALAVLQERVARHTVGTGGTVVKTEGDGAFLAFPTAESAIEALSGLQGELAQVPAETVPRLSVRAGAHTGDAVPVADDYVALAVNVAARVSSTAGAGQVVVSAATQAGLPEPVGVCVGAYDLKDVADPVELWRVCGDETPLRAPPARRTNVRGPVTSFVERDQELGELSQLLRDHSIVTVLGPGGLGKTRLVTQLVLRVAGSIPGGAWLVELAALGTGDQIPSAVAQVLGVRGGETAMIAAEIRRRGEVLLVLDNCEHLVDAVADLVIELHETCPDLRLLCTSREALQVPGEHVWRLPPFVPAARVELFIQRARASGATVHGDSTELLNRLCNALDGLPLAIELAATQSGSTNLEELVRIVEQGTDDLARRGGQARQRSLDAVLAWSLDCLPSPRRASLLALSILPGRFDLEMATAILAAVEECETDAVRPLARASLIDLDGESYRILETIRHAARRRLVNDPELAAAARLGLRTWALGLAELFYRVRRNFDDEPADWFLALEAALEHAVDDGATGIGKLWQLVRVNTVYREAGDRIINLAKRVLSGHLPADADETLCFTCAIDVLYHAESLTISDARLEDICAAADRQGVGFPSADLHYRVAAHLLLRRGDLAAGRRHAEAYAPFAVGPTAQPEDRVALHNIRSFVAEVAGDVDEALIHAERELVEAKSVGLEGYLGSSEGNLAALLLDAGRSEEALRHAAEAVRLVHLPGPRRRFVLLQLARAHTQLGEIDEALSAAREVEADLLASGRPHEQIQAELKQLREYAPALTE